MKGISLPIEMIVIIAIAVLVLVVIAAFFVGGAGQLGTTGDAEAFGSGCDRLRLQGCTADPNGITVENYNEPQKALQQTVSTNGGSLMRACVNLGRVIGTDPARECRIACGCPA